MFFDIANKDKMRSRKKMNKQTTVITFYCAFLKNKLAPGILAHVAGQRRFRVKSATPNKRCIFNVHEKNAHVLNLFSPYFFTF